MYIYCTSSATKDKYVCYISYQLQTTHIYIPGHTTGLIQCLSCISSLSQPLALHTRVLCEMPRLAPHVTLQSLHDDHVAHISTGANKDKRGLKIFNVNHKKHGNAIKPGFQATIA